MTDHPWLRARSIELGRTLVDKGYEYVLLEDAIEYAEQQRRLDMDRLARAVVEPYESDPKMGRCRVCGDDGVAVGFIEEPDDIAREYQI